MIAQEAKFELLKYRIHSNQMKNDSDNPFTEYLVKLVDADGVIVHYNITDYYNKSEEIIDTRIWKLSDKILDDLEVKHDSRLGKKILTFISNEHPYRGDVLESMYVKEQYENDPDDGSYKGR